MRTTATPIAALIASVLGASALITAVPASAAASPSADVQAGARSGPDTSWLSLVRPCNRYVSTTGSDTATGTTVAAAWRTVAKAMRTLSPGQTACVRAGTYPEGALVAARSGTADAPIAIRRFPGDPKPVLRATSDASLFDFTAAGQHFGYWLVDGFDIDKQHHDGASVRIEGNRSSADDGTLVSHVAVTNSRIRFGRSGAAILVRGRATDVLIRGNEISDHHRFGYWKNYRPGSGERLRTDYADAGLPTTVRTSDGTTYSYGREDAHGISVEGDLQVTSAPSVERVRVQGNRLLRNGGDGLQCVGPDDSQFAAHASDAADLDLVDNRMEANVEEGVDVKSCQWVSIRGSVSPGDPRATNAANNKMLNSRTTVQSRDLQYPSGGGNFGGGDLIVLHYAARHVLIENTRLWNACEGIAIGRDELAVQDVIVRRVLVFGMATKEDPACARDANTGSALRISRASHVDVYHNTFDMPADSPRAAVSVGSDLSPASVATGPFLTDIDFWNNIVRSRWWTNLALRVGPGSGAEWTNGFSSNNNVYQRVGTPAPAPDFILSLSPTYNFDAVTLPTLRAATGQDAASVEADPQFVADPAANDYYTVAGSPARDSAAVIPGYLVPPCPGKAVNPPDRGFRESC